MRFQILFNLPLSQKWCETTASITSTLPRYQDIMSRSTTDCVMNSSCIVHDMSSYLVESQVTKSTYPLSVTDLWTTYFSRYDKAEWSRNWRGTLGARYARCRSFLGAGLLMSKCICPFISQYHCVKGIATNSGVATFIKPPMVIRHRNNDWRRCLRVWRFSSHSHHQHCNAPAVFVKALSVSNSWMVIGTLCACIIDGRCWCKFFTLQ